MIRFALTVPEEDKLSLWEELWQYFENIYIETDAVHFENLGFGTGTMVTVRNILFALFLGIIIASVAAIVDKRYQGELVRKLLREECVGEENAKTLYELGLVTKFSARNAVRRSVNIRRVVKCREEMAYDAAIAQRREQGETGKELDIPYRIDVEADHFYIPEELKYTAEFKFEKKGTTWLWLAVIIPVCLVLFFGLLLLIPQILRWLNDMAGSMASAGNSKILT